MNKKIVAFLLAIILFFNFGFVKSENVYAAINTKYGSLSNTNTDNNEIGSSSIVLNWIGEIAYYFAEGVQTVGAKIMKIFTGVEKFPWADKIIFNTIPILDVNFINPASGSLFEDTSGNITKLGTMVRNAYFTILSIALGFLGIIIGIIAIRLAITSIASEKAKYKEAIVTWLKCLVLLFGMHYLLAFVFELNETMVELASMMLNDVLTSDTNAIASDMSDLSDENNEEIVNAFIKVATDKCFIADIPLIGDLYQGVLDFFQNIGRFLSSAWEAIKGWFTGDKSEAQTIEKDQLGTIYPNKDDYVNYIKENDTRINVAAYLIKNKYYRKTYLQWIKGNDTNSFDAAGLSGVGRNILISINDVFGVADTGYKALRTLFTSVALVTFKSGDKSFSGNSVPFDSTGEEAKNKNKESYDGMSDEDKAAIDKQARENSLTENVYYSDKITSTSAYLEYIDNAEKQLDSKTAERAEANKKIDAGATGTEKSTLEKSINDLNGQILALNLDIIYAQAYYKYVYTGSDKFTPKSSDLISELGEYFKNSSWYIDTANGDWSPTSINVVSAICYGIFVIQSLLFVFAYFKRFFYVVILSMLGPIVVVYDYVLKSI